MDNRKRAKYYMNLITISVTCLALVALLFIAIARIRTLMATVKEYEDRISADAGADRLYTADEVEKLLETDMQDAAIMERARIQTQIRKELLHSCQCAILSHILNALPDVFYSQSRLITCRACRTGIPVPSRR